MDERIIFPFEHMDFGLWKIRKAANVVKVHVGENDVFYIFGSVPESGKLVDCRLLRIKWHIGDDAEELCEPGRVGVVLQTETCIHEDRSQIGFNEKADKSCFPIAWEARTTGETIEDADGHDFNIA